MLAYDVLGDAEVDFLGIEGALTPPGFLHVQDSPTVSTSILTPPNSRPSSATYHPGLHSPRAYYGYKEPFAAVLDWEEPVVHHVENLIVRIAQVPHFGHPAPSAVQQAQPSHGSKFNVGKPGGSFDSPADPVRRAPVARFDPFGDMVRSLTKRTLKSVMLLTNELQDVPGQGWPSADLRPTRLKNPGRQANTSKLAYPYPPPVEFSLWLEQELTSTIDYGTEIRNVSSLLGLILTTG